MYDDEYQYQDQQYQHQKPTYVETVINNLLMGVVCIFLIAIFFFVCVVVVSVINTQTAIEYTTYTNDFVITNPAAGAVVYTGNPHLSSIVVTKYNASNATYGGVPDTDWTYDSTYGSIAIGAGILAWDISQLHVEAETDYSEAPVQQTLSAWAIVVVIGAICGFFGIVAYNTYQKQQQPPYVR